MPALFSTIEIDGRKYRVLEVKGSTVLLSRAGTGSVYEAEMLADGSFSAPRFVY